MSPATGGAIGHVQQIAEERVPAVEHGAVAVHRRDRQGDSPKPSSAGNSDRTVHGDDWRRRSGGPWRFSTLGLGVWTMVDTPCEGRLEFRILGPLDVRVDGESVPMRHGLTRALLLALLLRVGETVSTDALIDELYGDELPVNPLNALQGQVSYLRRALAKIGVTDVVVTESTGYRLAVAPSAVDAHRFAALAAEARSVAGAGTAESLEHAIGRLDEALALWRGEPLGDVAYRDFAASETARLGEMRLAALEHRLELQLALGRHRDAAGDLQALVKEHPLRERLHELLVLALYRAGRQADALRAYEAARRVLGDELGLEPGPELQRLERAVLDHDPAIEWVPPTTGGEPPRTQPPRADVAPEQKEAPGVAPLPAPVSRIIGRERDLLRLATLFGRSRLVTLTGPGGAGKTRLAVEYAGAHASDAWFVDLGEVAGAEAVASTVAAALGLPIRSTADPLAGAAALKPAGLLMLDTCEHVVEAAAATASQLLRSCPSLAVLATSRRPLEVAGEIAWAVPPLDLPGTDSLVDPTYAAESSAVRLLMERAMSVRLDFELTDANVADVVAICAALDGLPLAIELAAARLDVLSPARLRERLHDRFALLDAGHRDAVERQRTLRGAIDWSYELLTGDERRLFQRLAVLPGTFPLELAVALAGGLGPDGVDLLRSLVRQSLVTPHGEDRFVILDTLRAYAEERADAADSALALDRLAQWAATTVAAGDDALRSDAQVDALVALRQDLPNFRVALEWTLDEDRDPPLGVRVAARLAWFWHLTGMYSEGQRWLRTAVAVPDAEPRDRVLALIGAGLHATSVGLLQDGAAFLTRALDDARALDDRFLELLARAQRGGAAWWAGDPDAADADLDPVIDQAAGAHDERLQWIHAYALLQKSRVCLRREDYDAAASLVALADDELELVGDDHLRALAVRFQGRSATLQGSPARGIALAEQALRLSERLSDTEGVAISLLVLGEAQRGLGQFGQATATLGRSIELAVATDHLSTVCQAVSLLAAIDVERGDRERASRIVRELLTAQSEAGLPILTPGGVVQRLVGELLDGYPQAPDVGADPAAARARLRALALETIR